MTLRINNGVVVTPYGKFAADVLCSSGKIKALLAQGDQSDTADEVLDASGLLVFPGFIDPHVHSRDPGMTEKEDFHHSTRGALSGGVTTVLEMPNAMPPVTDAATFKERRAHHAEHAWVDFGLWGMTLGATNLEEIGPLFDEGAVGVKLFWGYPLRRDTKTAIHNLSEVVSDNVLLPPNNGEVLSLFKEVSRVGGVLAAHCEDRALMDSAEQELGHPMATYEDLLAVHSDLAEATSIAIAAQFARVTRCHFHVVHLASAQGLDVVRQAQRSGAPVSAETCPQYLTLTNESYERVGPLMKVYPPVRTDADQQALWSGISDRTITSIGSDHAPHTVDEKQARFDTQPAGVVGVETLPSLMVDAMLREMLSPEKLAWVLSEQTARLYGLWPRKGAVVPGADADFTLVNPHAEHVIRNEDLHSKHPVSPWNGVRVRGSVAASIIRGEVRMRHGEPTGECAGEFVPAKHGGRRANNE